MTDRIYIYDSTLRDGAQTQGVDFSVADKQAIAEELDKLGIDYIEGGWPGANPTDDVFFEALPKLKKAQITAFGKTRRSDASAENDPGLNEVLNADTKSVCIVGKSWDFHVKTALNVSEAENIAMVEDSIAYIKKQKREPMLDAEHFFDGYKANPTFAMKVVEAAYKAGARWVVLCDTNGGTMPDEIEAIVKKVTKKVPGTHLGIHCHNDTEQAVANSLAAVRAGVRQVQGTMNGVGERCGNANLTSIIPTLMLKMGYKTGITNKDLQQLTAISRKIDERLNRLPNAYAAYVGASAFAHKGGLHVSAVAKNPKSYEHIEPEKVGNTRNILVSDQAGRANILARLKEINIDASDEAKVVSLIEDIKQREQQGYAYDGADASFELLARKHFETVPDFFLLDSFRVTDERRYNAKGELITVSEATVKVKVEKRRIMEVAEGNGPVNALDKALRKTLRNKYPQLKDIELVDYKVRIIPQTHGTEAVIRVFIESNDADGNRWCTVGVSTNIIDASYNALCDSMVWKLLHS